MTKLEPGQRRPTTRRRWLVLALAVGGALAVLVVGTLFGVIGARDSAPTVQPIVRTPRLPAPVGAPAPIGAAPVVRAPPAPSGDGSDQPREITTQGPDGTTTTVVSPDGTVMSTTTTRAPN
jgi:hypothetical protein